MYMGSPIYRHEELRAGMLDAECSICRASAETECADCQADICRECSAKCAGCGGDNEYCLACAIKRGHVEIDGKHYCEECAAAMESELEEARR